MQQRRRPGYHYWFPARQRGPGWRLPHTWQGWISLDIYLGIVIISLFLVLFGGGGNAVFGFVVLLLASGAFLYICMKTGEPRRRR